MARYKALYDANNVCIDLEVTREDGSLLCILGSGGVARERAYLPKDSLQGYLPVFLGMGMGNAYEEFRKQHPHCPVAIVDKERDLWSGADIDGKISADNHVTFVIQEENPEKALEILEKWRIKQGTLPFYPLCHPFHQRLDKAYYGLLRENLEQSRQGKKVDFWAKMRSQKFRNKTTKLLLIASEYFLFGEVERACKRLGIECRCLILESKEMDSRAFVEQLLTEVLHFQPDALLTLNHSGIDREGLLMELLEKMQLPLISWFVDNPHLVLSIYAKLQSPWLHIFTWDKDNISGLHEQGFENVYYLPLGTDPERFHPQNKQKSVPKSWHSDVSFVGNSMHDKVEKRWEKTTFPKALREEYLALGAAFAKSEEKYISVFLMQEIARAQKNAEQKSAQQIPYASILNYYQNVCVQEHKLAFETGVTWEATRVYRLSCVEHLLDFNPLVVGDAGWKKFFPAHAKWRWHEPISYYTELPNFYTHSTINFNCTSMQMKGATNQRILDVPAAGAFVLTDWREQIDLLFEEGKEIICFKEQAEIPELIRFYLKHDREREAIVQAARKRVLACHTWENRVQDIVAIMREKYGS